MQTNNNNNNNNNNNKTQGNASDDARLNGDSCATDEKRKSCVTQTANGDSSCGGGGVVVCCRGRRWPLQTTTSRCVAHLFSFLHISNLLLRFLFIYFFICIFYCVGFWFVIWQRAAVWRVWKLTEASRDPTSLIDDVNRFHSSAVTQFWFLWLDWAAVSSSVSSSVSPLSSSLPVCGRIGNNGGSHQIG